MVPQETDRDGYRKGAGSRVRQLRTARGLKQAELAAKADLKQSDISAVERGARGMTPFQRAAIARALGVSQDVLDPMMTPQFGLAEALTSGSEPLSDPRSTLPPGLEAYLAKHPEIPDPVRWLLVENRNFRGFPWEEDTEATWERLARVAQQALADHFGKGGAKSGGPGRKG